MWNRITTIHFDIPKDQIDKHTVEMFELWIGADAEPNRPIEIILSTETWFEAPGHGWSASLILINGKLYPCYWGYGVPTTIVYNDLQITNESQVMEAVTRLLSEAVT